MNYRCGSLIKYCCVMVFIHQGRCSLYIHSTIQYGRVVTGLAANFKIQMTTIVA